jgi:hypothetical protein
MKTTTYLEEPTAAELTKVVRELRAGAPDRGVFAFVCEKDAAVVRARAWQPQDAPSAWCARRPGCTPFWGPDGQPLPAAQLSPPALTSAEAWRTAVVSTGDVPDALVLGAEEAINRLRPPQR